MKNRYKKMIAILLTIILAFGVSSSALAKGQSNQLHKFNGEEIFSGIVLGQGKVASLFPQIWTKDMLHAANEEENQKIALQIVDAMKKIDSSFFVALEDAVYSKNYRAVDKALSVGGELLLKAFDSLDLELKENDPITGTCVAWFVVLTAAVFISYVGAVHTAAIDVQVYAAVAYWTEVATSNSSKSSVNGISQLEKEIFVGKLIETLN